MSFIDSILTGLFCMVVVFAVLISLYLIIKLFSFLLGRIAPPENKPNQ